MSFEIERVSPIKYNVVSKGTCLVHSSFPRKKKAQSQIRLLNMLHGSGFFSDMANNIKSVANQAVQGGKDVINKVSDLGN